MPTQQHRDQYRNRECSAIADELGKRGRPKRQLRKHEIAIGLRAGNKVLFRKKQTPSSNPMMHRACRVCGRAEPNEAGQGFRWRAVPNRGRE